MSDLTTDEQVAYAVEHAKEILARFDEERDIYTLTDDDIDRCERVVCETWTPGTYMQPDGPKRHMHSQCVLPLGHENHRYGWARPVEVEVKGGLL